MSQALEPSLAPAAEPHKWLIAGTVMLGTFMAVMDISVVNVALPHMMGAFGQDISAITWVATAYAIAQIIVTTLTGWLSRLLGRKRLYMACMVIFIAGSILAGTAQTFPQMIIYRVIQGIGGGGLVPVVLSIMRESFPPKEQGMAMAIYSMGVVLAPAIGPILGGWLTDHYGWPWIFYINVPVSIPSILLAMAFLKDPPHLRRGVQRIDWQGITLLSIGLTAMQIVLERGQEEDWFASKWIVAGTVIMAVSLTALVLWELRVSEPVVNLRLFKNLQLSAGSVIGMIFGVSLMGTTFILPQFTQSLLGYPAFESGLVLLPRAIALFIMLPTVGWLFKFISGRPLVLTGIALICVAYYQLATLSLDVNFWSFVPMLMILGAGMPFMFVTLTAVSLSTIRKEHITDASSLYTLLRLVGGNIGYAMTATMVADFTQVHRSDLVRHISSLNGQSVAFIQQTAAGLVGRGLDPVSAQQTALALADNLVNRQAAMLAYNDTSWWMGIMFLIIVPLVFLLPREIHGSKPSLSVE